MRMYRDGILPSGEKMRADTSGGVTFTGAMAACAKCHRRSGMGSSEGGTRVRPVTGAALYHPEEVFGTGHVRKLPVTGDLPDRILEEAQGGNATPVTAVLWLHESDLRRLGERPWGASPPGRIYLSSTLAGTAAAVALGAPNREVYVVHPFALPKGKGVQDRIRIWLAARKVPLGDERLQFNAFFAAGITGDALDRMLDFFSRDYMLEWVEHMAEESINPSAYPRLSLGPSQRFGSKGSYILRYAPDGVGFAPVGGWIVPEWR
jgi:hypothetical protein